MPDPHDDAGACGAAVADCGLGWAVATADADGAAAGACIGIVEETAAAIAARLIQFTLQLCRFRLGCFQRVIELHRALYQKIQRIRLARCRVSDQGFSFHVFRTGLRLHHLVEERSQ
jgi:hypothetical protein